MDLRKIILRDTQLLKKLGLIDYSLLLGIEHKTKDFVNVSKENAHMYVSEVHENRY